MNIVIDSAGLHALPGCLPDFDMCSAAAMRGYDLYALRSRSLRVEDFERFDLILAIDNDCLSQLRARAPASASARIDLLARHSLMETPGEIVFMEGRAGCELMLDYMEDACLGVYHHLTASSRHPRLPSS